MCVLVFGSVSPFNHFQDYVNIFNVSSLVICWCVCSRNNSFVLENSEGWCHCCTVHARVRVSRAAKHGGGWGGTPPHEGEVPPHQGLSPPIQKNLSPPPWELLSPPWLKIFCALRARFHYFNSLSLGIWAYLTDLMTNLLHYYVG